MSRPSQLTRQSLIDEAIDIFAAKGFEGGSVRAITQKAKANQAAINYHFGSKEGLYQEVLRTSIEAFSEKTLLSTENVGEIERDEAVRLFMRQQLLPLLSNRRASRYVRIFAWESLAPTRVFQEYVASEQIPVMMLGERIVRRYLPAGATREESTVKTIWFVNQASTFIRHFGNLSRPPANLKIDQPFVERLADMLAALAIAALKGTGGGEMAAAS